jgi:hypothetical protein
MALGICFLSFICLFFECGSKNEEEVKSERVKREEAKIQI